MEKKDYKLFFKTIIKEALLELLSDEQILSKIKKNLKQEGVSSESLNLKESVRTQQKNKIDPKLLDSFRDLQFDPISQIRMARENPQIRQIIQESKENNEFDNDDDEGLDISQIQKLMLKK